MLSFQITVYPPKEKARFDYSIAIKTSLKNIVLNK